MIHEKTSDGRCYAKSWPFGGEPDENLACLIPDPPRDGDPVFNSGVEVGRFGGDASVPGGSYVTSFPTKELPPRLAAHIRAYPVFQPTSFSETDSVAIPTNIQNDVNALETAIGQLQTDQAALPALQASASAASAALAAGQAAVTTDTTAVSAALTQLQADIAALENPAPPPPAPASH